MLLDLADDGVVSDTIEVGRAGSSAKRVHRPAEEKRRIVEATLLPGVSIARVAREHGVNANQVFQWRYEYRNSALVGPPTPRTELLPVTVVAEPSSVMAPEVAPVATSSGLFAMRSRAGVRSPVISKTVRLRWTIQRQNGHCAPLR